MKLKFKPIHLALIFGISTAYADPSSAVDQLQTQINALQAQINQLDQVHQNALSNVIGLDTADPFGTLSKVNMPLQLLKNRSQNSAALTLSLIHI
jgi:hypothetical protein